MKITDKIFNTQKKNKTEQYKTKNTKLSNYKKQKYGVNLDESIQIFTNLISQGPIFVCSVCQQTNFKDKVTTISKIHNTKHINLFHECKN